MNEFFKASTHVEVKPGIWIVRYSGGAADVTAILSPRMDRGDGIFVCSLGEDASWHLPGNPTPLKIWSLED